MELKQRINGIPFIKIELKSILEHYKNAYPGGLFDANSAHSSLHSIHARTTALLSFIENIKEGE